MKPTRIFQSCIALSAIAIAALLPLSAHAGNRPFPQHTTYTAGTIKPNNVTQATMDSAVQSKWNTWKSAYLKPAGTGKYYVKYDSTGATVSEAHGYGMLLTVIMEGYDANAKTYFDGLYNYYKAHPSVNNQYLMAWKQNSSFVNVEGADSATDGDMDIAYSLLLADKQWGSAGTINYLTAAKNCINAIMANDVNQTLWNLRVGDWATGSEGNYTRPSDFMLGHMKAYKAATGDTRWDNVIATTYSVINTIFSSKSPNTGLICDFCVRSGSTWVPAPESYLPDEQHEPDYAYNSCRTPWRFAVDYLMNGDTRAFSQMQKMNSWIKTKTSSTPGSVRDGYTLAGSTFGTSANGSFVPPFGVSAMIDSAHQSWLNAVWGWAVSKGTEEYYEDSIKIHSMIVMSGNWWAPTGSTGTAPTITSTAVTTGIVGNAYSYDVNATGTPAPTYSLTTSPAGMTINTSSGIISWTPSATGSFAVTVKAANGTTPDATQSFTVVVGSGGGGGAGTYQAEDAVLAGGTIAETVNGGFNGTGYANLPATGGTVTFNNVDGGSGGAGSIAIRYANGGAASRTGNLVVNGSTVSVTFPVTGWTTWTTLNVAVTLTSGATNTIQLASTGQDLANIDEITVTGGSGGTAPTITSTPGLTGTVGTAYSYDVNATGSPAPTYSLTASPSGMTISASTGVISWTPLATGSYPVTVQAANGTAPNATQSFTIVVSATPTAVTYEAESLTVSSTSGDAVATNTDGGSGGAYVGYSSNAVGDQITFTIPNVAPGAYTVTVGWKKYTSRAIVQTLAGIAGGTLSNLGGTVDLYNSTTLFTETTLSSIWTIGTQGDKSVQFKVTGKNASSSGYVIAVDYIKLTPQ